LSLGLDFQCRDDVPELEKTFQDRKELKHLPSVKARFCCCQAFPNVCPHAFQIGDDVSEFEFIFGIGMGFKRHMFENMCNHQRKATLTSPASFSPAAVCFGVNYLWLLL